jgi:hypothetical protein
MKTIDELLAFCKENIADLDEYVLANDSDSEYFSGVQSAYAQVVMFMTGTDIPVPQIPYPEM